MAVVSVIIPLYNKEKYVRRTLDSVFAQSYQDFEVVVVDDGSTDSGPEIVNAYTDPRLRLIRQANAGPGAARNRGFKESKAPWVAFLDADDEWLPDFLRISMDVLESHPECEVYIASRHLGPSRKDLTPMFMQWGLRTGEWLLKRHTTLAEFEKVLDLFFTGAAVIRHNAFQAAGGFYDRARTISGEDKYLWLQLMLTCKVYMMLRPLVWYHYEASELGCQWKNPRVVSPCLTDPDPIRKKCGAEHMRLLEELLTTWFSRRVAELCECQDTATARYLCTIFSSEKRSTWQNMCLRLMISHPKLYRAYRSAKAHVRAYGRRCIPPSVFLARRH